MIELLIFDLDGVITNTSKIHFNALNRALSDIDSSYCVTEQEDSQILGTRTTREKLKIISEIKGLPKINYNQIIDRKKAYALEIINALELDEYFSLKTLGVINKLKNNDYLVALASNTNKEFINLILEKTGLSFDFIYHNGDIRYAKPHPEIYLRCFLDAGVSPDQVVIFEDSIVGQEAAIKSGAHVYPISDTSDIDYHNIMSYIDNIKPKPVKWQSNKINVVIPMAGQGSRFASAGFTKPKPLIDVRGVPMVLNVVNHLQIDANFIFIVKEEHNREYYLETLLKTMVPNCTVHLVQGKQEGAATTILQAKSLFDNENPLVICNSDQVWDWDARNFWNQISKNDIDGSIVVFEDKTRDTKWSFAKLDEHGYVCEVAEKQPISDLATGGIYAFKHGSDFVKYATQMVQENVKVNGEYYVCPVYNFAIRDGKRIDTFMIDKFWPTGTPSELEHYLTHRK